jgi:hypothetical protein
MHIENELVEYVIPDEQEYDEVIKEHEEEVLVQEEFPELPMTDTANAAPTQGKPRCMTFILLITIYYIYYAFTLQELYEKPHTHTHTYTYKSY